jgi:hypothetical protein
VIVANSSKPVNKNNNNRQQQGDKSLQSQENNNYYKNVDKNSATPFSDDYLFFM